MEINEKLDNIEIIGASENNLKHMRLSQNRWLQ